MRKLISVGLIVAILAIMIIPALAGAMIINDGGSGYSNTIGWDFDGHGVDGWVSISATKDAEARVLCIGSQVHAEWWTIQCDVEAAAALFDYSLGGYRCVDLDSDSARIWWGGTATVYAHSAFSGGNGYGPISLGRVGINVDPLATPGGGIAIYSVDFTGATPTFTRDRDAELIVALQGIIGGLFSLAGYIGG